MNENQRVRLSKQLLKESMLELMKKKNIRKISIKEICDLAEVNRSTFYKHYSTELDLLKEIENEHLIEIEKFLEISNSSLSILNLLLYVEKNIEIFKIFLDNTSNISFLEKLITMCFLKMNYNELLIKCENKIKQEYTYEFIIFGCLNIVKKWIYNNTLETPEEINCIILDVVSKFLITN